MELMYPAAIIVCILIALVIFFVNFTKDKKYTQGKKVANTKYIKETQYYKNKIRKYKIISYTIKITYLILIISIGVLIARPVVIQTKTEDKYNRDIFLSIDFSGSQDEVNLELVKKFRAMIPNINGDRIGIVIYNTAPIVYCPLTEDYDYLDECLEIMQKQLQSIVDNDGRIPYNENDSTAYILFNGGVVANYDERGSSLVADGLAGTIFSFPDVKENKDRTRIIVFATDNNVEGKETISLEEACSICKKYNINIYAYCPTKEMNEYVTDENLYKYKNAIENYAGGKFYTGDLAKMTSAITDEIKETKASLLKTSKKTIITDYPEFVFVVIAILFCVLVIMEKAIKM